MNRLRYDRLVRDAENSVDQYVRAALALAIALERDDKRAGFKLMWDHVEVLRDELAVRDPRRRAITRGLAKTVFERDAYRCVECGDWHDLTVDHIRPVVAGGGDDLENLRTLCRSCNSRKGSRPL